MTEMSAPTFAEVTEADYHQYLAGLLAGDRDRCASVARGLRASGVGVRQLYLKLFQRGLYDIGALWQQGRISVAVEHLATALTERLLSIFHSEIFAGPRRQRSALIACPGGELHQLGGRMVADFFEMQGWRGDFLGANTPHRDLVSMIGDRKPDMLGLSVSTEANVPAMFRAVAAVTAAHPDLDILIGGQGFQGEGCRAVAGYPRVMCIGATTELEGILAAYDSR